MLLTRSLLKAHKDVRKKYQNLFQFILVDEYQDTNNLQESISELLLKNGNLFCVGDDWQAIYSFRGSNVNHFLSFRKKFRNARIFRLEQNYRSADEIVQLETFEKCFPLKAGFKFKPACALHADREGEDLSADASLRVTGGIY